MQKSASPDPVATGQLLTYDLEVTNHGAGLVLESDITDNLPPEVAFVSCTVHSGNMSASCNGGSPPGQVTANLGPLPGGVTASLTVVVRVVAVSGTITNTATVGFNGMDPNPSNNSSTVVTTIGSGPSATGTATVTPTVFFTATPTPIAPTDPAPSIPVLSDAALISFVLALLAAGWVLSSRQS